MYQNISHILSLNSALQLDSAPSTILELSTSLDLGSPRNTYSPPQLTSISNPSFRPPPLSRSGKGTATTAAGHCPPFPPGHIRPRTPTPRPISARPTPRFPPPEPLRAPARGLSADKSWAAVAAETFPPLVPPPRLREMAPVPLMILAADPDRRCPGLWIRGC